MRPKCLIYVRFSTLEQQQGASIARQSEDCARYAESMGWDHEIKIDEGKSAFHGANRSDGTVLGDFEREVVRGDHHGRVLLVERLDRISRLDWDETLAFLQTMNRNGVTVATVDGPRQYRPGERIDTGPLIELIVKIKVAHESSLEKQQRLRDKWARHRAAAAEGRIVTKTGPAWLTLSEDRQTWVPDPAKVEIVRRIFNMSDAGAGALLIARKLNEEGIAPWPRYKNRVPKFWDRKFISSILTNEAVIGDKQFYEEEGKARVSSGEPIRGYYPAIVETDVFNRVRLAAGDRKLVAGGRNGAVLNIASGLTKCAECGSSMMYVSGAKQGQVRVRGGKEIAPTPYDVGTLYCRQAQNRGGCTNTSGVAYLGFERGLLDTALHLSIDDKLFSDDEEVGRLARLIADENRNADLARRRVENLWRAYSETGDDMAMKMASEAGAALKTIEAQVVELNKARDKAAGAADAAEQLSRLTVLREELYASDLDVRRTARAKVAQGLVAVIDRIECGTAKAVAIHFRGGVRIAVIKPRRGRAGPEVMNFDLLKEGRGFDHVADPVERAQLEAYARRNAEAKEAADT